MFLGDRKELVDINKPLQCEERSIEIQLKNFVNMWASGQGGISLPLAPCMHHGAFTAVRLSQHNSQTTFFALVALCKQCWPWQDSASSIHYRWRESSQSIAINSALLCSCPACLNLSAVILIAHGRETERAKARTRKALRKWQVVGTCSASWRPTWPWHRNLRNVERECAKFAPQICPHLCEFTLNVIEFVCNSNTHCVC